MQIQSILDRTVGFEIEVANAHKSSVFLPDGYDWSEETILNTNGKIVKMSSDIGGEINTPPIKLCREDWLEFEQVFNDLMEAGAKGVWRHGFDGHIYVGDLDVDGLKRIFMLSFYTSDFIKKFCDFGEWFDNPYLVPTPSVRVLDNVKRATTFDELRKVFVNNSKKGYFRYLVNITSYYKTKTVEFRLFNCTEDFEEIKHSALFMYRFVDYAIRHTESDFMEINTYDKFLSRLKLRYPLARKVEPLICASSYKDYPRCTEKPITYSSKIVKKIEESINGGSIALVNPNMFQLEIKLSSLGKNVIIYNRDRFNHAIYRIAQEGVVPKWRDKFDFFNAYSTDDPAVNVTLLILFHRLQRYTSSHEYYVKLFDSYVAKMQESIEHVLPFAKSIVELLENSEYKVSTINDAIKGEGTVFFQFDDNSKNRSAYSNFCKYSDYECEIDMPEPNYYNIISDLPKKCHFMLVSRFEFLPLHKIASRGEYILYSSEKAKGEVDTKEEGLVALPHIYPPDDLEIADHRKIRVVQIKSKAMHTLQKQYVKLVAKVTPPLICYAVMYEDYLLGAFGFELSKQEEYDLWLLSDFITNNNIPRVGKLILWIIQTREIRKALQRVVNTSVDSIYTKAYTINAVSMKYRGVFQKCKDKDKQDDGYILYTSDMGIVPSIKEVVARYKQQVEKASNYGKR